jgi:hypothetical protein
MFRDDTLDESASSKVTIDDFSPKVMQKFLFFLSGKDIELDWTCAQKWIPEILINISKPAD